MNTNPLHESAIIIHGIGIGAVTRGMVRQRAAELAAIDGREPHEASRSDWDEAQRELCGGAELDPQQTMLESVPESDRWNPVSGSEGHEALVAFGDNEDEDGRSVGERLYAEGVEEAGHDQMVEAAESDLSAGD
jgi:hypothetical protein